jgi:hypothetical protein
MPFPARTTIRSATLAILRRRAEPLTNKQLYAELRLHLPDVGLVEATESDGRSHFEHEVRWAIHGLRADGLIRSMGRGRWQAETNHQSPARSQVAFDHSELYGLPGWTPFSICARALLRAASSVDYRSKTHETVVQAIDLLIRSLDYMSEGTLLRNDLSDAAAEHSKSLGRLLRNFVGQMASSSTLVKATHESMKALSASLTNSASAEDLANLPGILELAHDALQYSAIPSAVSMAKVFWNEVAFDIGLAQLLVTRADGSVLDVTLSPLAFGPVWNLIDRRTRATLYEPELFAGTDMALELRVPDGRSDGDVVLDVQELVLAIDSLHRAFGGRGITVRQADVYGVVPAPVEVPT